MSTAINNMKEEHQLILKVLASFDQCLKKLSQGEVVPRADIAKYGDFFRNFADKLHHSKEEDRLFTKMIQSGFPKEYGPIGVMLSEHDSGREKVRSMIKIGSGEGELTENEKNLLIGNGSEFVQLLFFHIHKEDNVLYPMALQSLPPEDVNQLDSDCEGFDKQEENLQERDRLRKLAEELLSKYPSTVESLQANLSFLGGCGMFGCGH